ncbi:MAG: helix-turn-helix domain-containing protein, partial [Snowella sp.]|nr:helix-turn-helix domain-containing protein [Snowella sp.]
MGRSLQVKPEFIQTIKGAVRRNGYPSQQALASELGLSRDVVSRFLNGKPVDYLNALEICRALNLDLGEMTGYGQPVTEQPRHRVDLGEATDTLDSFSREEELQTLEKWIIQDHCRFVLIEGMKGMGKNNLSLRLGKRLQEHFNFVVWRSLDQYSSLTEFINDLCCFFTEKQDANSAEITLVQKYELLKGYLSENKCLVILANVHLLYEDNCQFNLEPINYKKLLSWITEKQKSSCIVLTSSVEPPEIGLLIDQSNLACRFGVKGLSVDQIKSLFSNVGVFSGFDQDWQNLERFYSGNLFVLQNIALNIRDNFGGNISLYLSFIDKNNPVFNGTEEFLDQEFKNLSAVERDVMCWLAIYHHSLNVFELKDIVTGLFGDQLLMIIEKLKLRFFIEGEGEGIIAQPPMIRSFFVKQLVEKITQEIIRNCPDFLTRYPLLITNAKAKVRKDQEKIFLKPIVCNLTNILGYSQAQEKLETILKLPQSSGYTVGNIVNLLRQLENYHFEDQVFSNLTIKNADFRAIHLQNTDFSRSELSNCLFQDGFSNVLSVAFSPDGQYLAMGDNHAQVYLWQVTENRLILHNIITSDNYWVRTVAFSPDSQLLASGGDDNIVYLREVKDKKLVARLEGHIERIRSLSFSPDGKYLASSGDDWTIRIWDLANLQLVTVLNQHQDKVRTVIFSTDGQLISASQDNQICIWQVGSFELVTKFLLSDTQGLLRTVALSPDGQTLATGNDDNIIRLWTLDGKFIRDFRGHSRWLRSLAFSPDGNQLASASEDQTIRLWDVKTSQCLHILKGHKARIWSVAYHPQRSWLVAGDDSRKIKLWQTETGECLGRFEGYSQKIGPLAFHPNGQTLATQSIINEEISNCFNLLLLPTDSWNILSLAYDPK